MTKQQFKYMYLNITHDYNAVTTFHNDVLILHNPCTTMLQVYPDDLDVLEYHSAWYFTLPLVLVLINLCPDMMNYIILRYNIAL